MVLTTGNDCPTGSYINLPGPSGFSVMRTIRRLEDPAARAVPAIALSGYGDQLGLTPMLEAGFNDFLGKPVRMDRFLRAVRGVANRPPRPALVSASVSPP